MPHNEIQAWIDKGQSDLVSAEILLAHNPPITDTAAFHCQQAAEKYLKAFLINHQKHFSRVHSLVYLVDLCREIVPELDEITEAAAVLTPYAVLVRYPGHVTLPTEAQAEEAYAAAKTIISRINNEL